uniref:Glycosyl hydrolase family 88 n=1 Tax=Bionectria ochroleuca TaxID=29856 RepID=A0A0B7JSC4_BIOOC
MADTFIQDGVTPNYGYQVATLYLGFEKAYEISKDEKYLDWYKGQIDDHVVLENGTIKNWNYTRYVLDEYRIANNYLYLYDKTGLEKYKSAANIALKKTRDVDSGTWWQVMEDPYPTYEENFIEASGSAMFTYGWFKGITLGYLPKEAYLETAKDSYTSIVKNFISEAEDNRLVLHGTVDECNLIGKVDLAYYFSRPIRDNHKNGVGPFMLASFEWETWAKDA